MKNSPEEKWIWAFDPKDEATKPETASLKNILAGTGDKLEILPAYVVSVPPYPIENPEEAMQTNALSSAEAEIELYFKKWNFQNIKAPLILPVRSQSSKRKAAEILSLARQEKAGAILLSSHGRSGLSRLLKGSFAETLMANSHCPIFFLPRGSLLERKEELTALFATDFSDPSLQAYADFLRHCRTLKLNLILFHSVSLPSTALDSSYGTPVILPDNFFEDQMRWAEKTGHDWIQMAAEQGVSARMIVIDSGIGPHTAEVILNQAQKVKANFIVMATQSSESRSFFLGSVAREIFRSLSCPVWVYGPHSLESQNQSHIPGSKKTLASSKTI